MAGGDAFEGSNHWKDHEGNGEEKAPAGDLGVGLNAKWIGQKEGCLNREQPEQRHGAWGLVGVDGTGRTQIKEAMKN